LKEFDPFGAQKEASFLASLPQITNLASYFTGLISKPKQSPAELRVEFEHLLLVSKQTLCTITVKSESLELLLPLPL